MVQPKRSFAANMTDRPAMYLQMVRSYSSAATSEVSEHVAHQTWTKVTGEVDGVSGLPSEARTDAENEEEHRASGTKVSGGVVALVTNGEDDKHEDPAGDELGEELARLGQERGRIRAEMPAVAFFD